MGLNITLSLSGARSVGSGFTPAPAVSNLQDLNSTTSYVAITSGAAWGDSITRNNQSNDMLGFGVGYSGIAALSYSPSGADDVIEHDRWPTEVGDLVTNFANEGVPGETSTQITTRMQAGSASNVDFVSFGTNDGVNTVAKQQTVYDNVDAIATAGFPKASTVFMPYVAGGGISASSYGLMAYARAQGFEWFDWNTAAVKSAHGMEADTVDLSVNMVQAAQVRAFMSTLTAIGGLDTTHPGSAWSRALSPELAAMAQAIANPSTSPPYMRMQFMPVDWSVSEGTVIGTLDTLGTVENTAINNALGNAGLITLNGTQVLRGSAAAPSASWVDHFIEVQNGNGSFLQRLSFGDSTGRTAWKQAFPVLNHYLTGYGTTAGTISVVGTQATSATSRFMLVGGVEVQVRPNGDLWFKGPFSSNVIYGGSVGDNQHWMMTWSGSTCYTVLDETYTDRSGIFTGLTDGINGPLSMFGAVSGNPSGVVDSSFECEHIYISDSYHGPGSDLSPIWDSAGEASNITGASDVLSGDTPAYSMRGGPGNFAALNYGDAGAPGFYPHWNAANARLH